MLTATQAGALLAVTDRTLRKYARAGRLTREFGADGHPQYRREEVEALRHRLLHAEVESGPDRPRVRTGPRVPAQRVMRPDRTGMEPERNGTGPDSLDNGPLNAPRQEAAPLACACCKVRESEVDHLRAQLDARTREMERRDQAEGELRRVLALLEQTNRELSAALVTRALPLPPAPLEAPKRARWIFWRR